MEKRISIRQYLINYNNGKYDAEDFDTQVSAGWYDWFCDDDRLKRKTVKLTRYLKSIVESEKMNIDTMYVFFKNNAPLNGRLYDDFRICDLKTGDVIYTIVPKSGFTKNEGKSEVWGRENQFRKPLVTGSWNDVRTFFCVPLTPAKTRKPKAKMLGEDANIYNLLCIADRALRQAGQLDEIKEMDTKVFQSHSYSEALGVITDYVDIR